MKVYFPIRWVDVPASSRHHPPNTHYRVSVGHEHWDEGPARVLKVQMVYDGNVSGRRSPSFPEGTDDWARVVKAMERVRKGEGQSGRGQASTP